MSIIAEKNTMPDQNSSYGFGKVIVAEFEGGMLLFGYMYDIA